MGNSAKGLSSVHPVPPLYPNANAPLVFTAVCGLSREGKGCSCPAVVGSTWQPVFFRGMLHFKGSEMCPHCLGLQRPTAGWKLLCQQP